MRREKNLRGEGKGKNEKERGARKRDCRNFFFHRLVHMTAKPILRK